MGLTKLLSFLKCLTKMKNKDYYWLFIKKSIQKITGTSKWERELSSNDIHWKDYFKQLKCICKENKLSVEELLFGKLVDGRQPLLKKLNYSMLFAKYYLYHQKLNQVIPDLNEFVKRLNTKYCVESLT